MNWNVTMALAILFLFSGCKEKSTTTNNSTTTNVESTDDVPEGIINLYYTDARVSANVDVATNSSSRHSPVSIGTPANGLSLSGQEISLGLSSGSATGALSSSDFSAFSSKEPGLGNPAGNNYVLSSDTGGTRSWRGVETLTNPASFITLFEEWITGTAAGSRGWVSVVNGTGAACSIPNLIDNIHLGVAECTTGTNASGRSTLHLGIETLALGNGQITTEILVRIPTLSDGTNTYTVYLGLGDNTGAGDNVDGITFIYGGSFGTNWQARSANNSSRTTVNTGIVVSAGTWTKLRITANAAGNSVDYYVGSTLAATINTDIPGATRAFGPLLKIQKSLGATARVIQIDYFSLRQTLTTTR